MLKYVYNSAYGDVAVFRLSDITFVIITPEGNKEEHKRLVTCKEILEGNTDTPLDDLPDSTLLKIVNDLSTIKADTVMLSEENYRILKEDANKWLAYSTRRLESPTDTSVQL